jgi:hypothetical protein
LARESGFLVRKSKFTIGSFLDVLYDSFTDTSPTLTDYAIIFKKNNGNSISKQAIDQRFDQSLKRLLENIAKEILSKQIN